MATYLLTVRQADRTGNGLQLSPGIRLSQTSDRATIGKMIQGAQLELRRPDGMRCLTHLVSYGVSVWRGDDGKLYTRDDPSDPEIKLILPEDVTQEDVTAGTEVWLVEVAGAFYEPADVKPAE